jgi:AraC-like DNA-binding protein
MVEEIRARRAVVDAVRSVIADRMASEELSLESVGDSLGVHPRTLQRRLARVDLTYQQLVDEVRFDLARSLLESPKTPLHEIAGRLGYGDPAHFSRAFNRWKGMSPRAYRDRASGRAVERG